MDITKENIDDLNAQLRVKVEKSDYEEKVQDTLADYRKKANINGFRPGKAPMGLINKMYGKAVLVDEINKIVSESISKYIRDEKLSILGEPMPSEEEQQLIDWDKQKEFEFVFDLGLSPDITIDLTKKDKVPFYEIKIDDQLIDSYKNGYAQRYGAFIPKDKIEDKELLKGQLTQLDAEGNILPEGIKTEEASILLEKIQDKEIKDKFIGQQVGAKVEINVKKAFPNESDLAALLSVKKEILEEMSPDFQVEIKSISIFKNSEINQDLFDKIYGKDKVKSEEEFIEKIKEELKISLLRESDYRFVVDAKNKLIEKQKIQLPEKFLKRWLYTINKGKFTYEQIEKDFNHFADDLKWQLIKDNIIKENDIKVNNEELREFAKELAITQFRQYGIMQSSDENLNNYIDGMLKNEDEKKKMYERKYEEKVIFHVREHVKLDVKKVTTEEFNKLFEK